MILIADSGATKTDWLLINNSNYTFITTAGINAYYMSSEVISAMLNKELLPHLPLNNIRSVYYYGSGCSTEQKCRKISDILQQICPGASIEVNHDMLAAARALCDSKPGIACILGTGSNSCVYDGKVITRQMVSLGYFFGDEGSGTHLGKLLITDYLRSEMPDRISNKLNEEYNLSLEYVLDHIYNQTAPNRFLASFSPFIQQNSNDEYIRKLIAFSFNEFLKVGVMKFTGYQSMDVSFVGSVAYYYQDILMEVAANHKIKIGKIQKSVIEGLRDFHREVKS
jgi:glucosamine kinase